MLRILTFLFVLFLLTLAVVGLTMVQEQDRLLAQARQVPADIVRSEVTSSEFYDTKGRRVGRNQSRIEYRYTVDGRDYLGTDVDAAGSGQSHGRTAQETVEAYPAGTRVTAYVDPLRPERAFLERRHSFSPYLKVLMPLMLLPFAAAVLATSVRGPTATGSPIREDNGWYRLVLRNRMVPDWVWPTTGLLGLIVGGLAILHYFVRAGMSASTPAIAFSLLFLALSMLPIWQWLFGRGSTGPEQMWVHEHPIRLTSPVHVRADVPDVTDADELRFGLLCRRVERRPIHKGERFVRPVIAESWVDAEWVSSSPGHYQATLTPAPAGVESAPDGAPLPKVVWELVAERRGSDGSQVRTVAPIRVEP